MIDVVHEEERAPKRRLSPPVVAGLLLGLLVVAIVTVGWAVYFQTHGRYLVSTDDAYIRADAVTVSAKVSGYVEEVYVGDNQPVTAGQPLVRIDPRDYKAQAAQYQAQIDVADADAANVEASIRQQEAAVEQARAQLAAARTDQTFAASQVERYGPLAASGAETREKLSNLKNQASQAANTVAARAAALAEAERRIAGLKAQVRQADAQSEAAKAQLSAADVNLASTTLRAPVAGKVGDKGVRVGQFVQPGLRLMSVVPVQAIYIVANYKETQIGLMRPGQPATIAVDALPGVRLHGHVDSVAPGTDAQFSILPPQNATGNFTKIVQRVPVRIAIDAGPEARRVLVPGLSLTVVVDTLSMKGDLQRIKREAHDGAGA